MRRLTMWVASVAGAAGAGAGIAVARHRRRAAGPGGHPVTPPAPPAAAPPTEAPVAPAEDPQAALDAARRRLRDRADDVRRDMESWGGTAGDG